MNGALLKLALKGIGYNSLSKIMIMALTGISQIVLARNLTQGDFGIVGFATIFINFLAGFSDIGISSAIIQKNDLDKATLFTGFTLKLILGGVVFCIAMLLSVHVDSFFYSNQTSRVIQILSLNFIISSFAFIPTCLLTRDLNYKKLLISQTVTALINYILSIALALNGFSYWSIVISNIVAAVVNIFLLNFLEPVRIEFRLDKKIASELVHFGGNLFLCGVITFVIFNADNFIIGSVSGAVSLGYYAIAFNWSTMVCGVVHNAVLTVLFPVFSKMQSDRDGLKKAYLKLLEYSTFICVLVNATLFYSSYEFLFYILGHGTDKWIPVLSTLKILCVYGVLRGVLQPLSNIVMAIGRTDIMLKTNFIVAIVELSLIYPALKYFDIEGVAATITLSYGLQFYIYYKYMSSELDVKSSDVISSIKPSFLSLIVVIALSLSCTRVVEMSYVSFAIKLTIIPAAFCLFYQYITKWRLLGEMKVIINGLNE